MNKLQRDSIKIIVFTSICCSTAVHIKSCSHIPKEVQAKQIPTDNLWRNAETSSYPTSLTKEEYSALNNQDRYGACYPYCKEANQYYIDEIWRLMDIVQKLKKTVVNHRIRLELCQDNVSVPPIDCKSCIEILNE